MPVALNNGTAAAWSSGGSTTVTFSYSCSSGSGRLLLVQTHVASGSVTSVTYAGAGLTSHATGGSMTLWRKTAPASGADNIVTTIGTYNQALFSVSDWTGVDQTTPLGTQVTATGTSTTPATGSVTCPANGAVWGGMYADYSTSPGTISAGSGTTLLGWVRESANGRRKAGGYRFNTGTISFSQSPSTVWGAQAVPINPSVSFTAKLPEIHLQAVQRSVI